MNKNQRSQLDDRTFSPAPADADRRINLGSTNDPFMVSLESFFELTFEISDSLRILVDTKSDSIHPPCGAKSVANVDSYPTSSQAVDSREESTSDSENLEPFADNPFRPTGTRPLETNSSKRQPGRTQKQRRQTERCSERVRRVLNETDWGSIWIPTGELRRSPK